MFQLSANVSIVKQKLMKPNNAHVKQPNDANRESRNHSSPRVLQFFWLKGQFPGKNSKNFLGQPSCKLDKGSELESITINEIGRKSFRLWNKKLKGNRTKFAQNSTYSEMALKHLKEFILLGFICKGFYRAKIPNKITSMSIKK